MTPEQIRSAVAAWNASGSVVVAARKAGVHRDTARRALIREGVYRANRATAADIQQIGQLLRKGRTVTQVANQTGWSVTTVRRILKTQRDGPSVARWK